MLFYIVLVVWFYILNWYWGLQKWYFICLLIFFNFIIYPCISFIPLTTRRWLKIIVCTLKFRRELSVEDIIYLLSQFILQALRISRLLKSLTVQMLGFFMFLDDLGLIDVAFKYRCNLSSRKWKVLWLWILISKHIN